MYKIKKCNENKKETIQEIIFLYCQQGLHKNQEGHYDKLKLKNKEPTFLAVCIKIKKALKEIKDNICSYK